MENGEDKIMQRVPFHLDVLIGMEDGQYVAHCLQFDLVAVASTPEQAVRDIEDLISTQIEFAVEHDNMENIFCPAPPEYWEKLWRAKRQPTPSCDSHDVTVGDQPLRADFCYAA